MSEIQKTTMPLSGMTCTNCEVVVERTLRALPGVVSAQAVFSSGTVRIEHDSTFDEEAAVSALLDEGYAVGTNISINQSRRFAEAGAALFCVITIMFVARQIDWPKGISVNENMGLGLVFAIGLLASVSSCIAVTGGLLVALAAKYNDATSGLTTAQRFVPHLWFNAGRVISYTMFGTLLGTVGSVLTLSPSINGMLTIIISILMMALGLQMLGFLPRFSRLLSMLPNSALHRIHDLANRTSRAAAFLLGGLTFFLPCGFTLALQLYVLAKGDARLGAMTMLVFALGTLPALLGLSLLSSFTKGSLRSRFLTISGAFVVVLGFVNVQYGLVQLDQKIPAIGEVSQAVGPTSTVRQGLQIIEMTVSGLDYMPNRFVVKAGVPVEWRIDAKEAEGCGRILISRSLGLQKFLSASETTVISFTPMQPGEYSFNCGMGMMTPNSGFRVTG